MISIYGFRQDGRHITNDVPPLPPLHEAKIENALILFAKYELGYGGRVVSIAENDNIITIKTETRVLNKLDTTVFSGSKEEMEPLLKIAYIISSTPVETQVYVDIITEILGDRSGIPFFLANFSPLIIGNLNVKAALLTAFGAEPNTEKFKKLEKFKIEDLCAAWALNDYKINDIENIL